MAPQPDTPFPGFDLPRDNWSKTPHALIAQFPRITTVAEIKVIFYVLRHTWGYQEYNGGKRITLDEFCHGRKRRDGSRIDPGTGLSPSAVKDGVRAAVAHGFLIRESDGRDAARNSHVYRLRMATEPAGEVDGESGLVPPPAGGPGDQPLPPADFDSRTSVPAARPGYRSSVPGVLNSGTRSGKDTLKDTYPDSDRYPSPADGAPADGGGTGSGIAESQNGRISESRGAAHFERLSPEHGALDAWEANRFVKAWLDAHPAVPFGDIIALGQALEEQLGMRPDWAARSEVNSWLSGLAKALRAADGDGDLVVSVALDMRDGGLAIPEPYSLVKMVRDAAAQERAAQTRATQTRASPGGIVWLD